MSLLNCMGCGLLSLKGAERTPLDPGLEVTTTAPGKTSSENIIDKKRTSNSSHYLDNSEYIKVTIFLYVCI